MNERAARAAVATAALIVMLQPAGAQVETSQYNNARTGVNAAERVLTPRNVNARTFGKLFTLNVDGDVYAEPLYLPRLAMRGKTVHDVVFVATEADSVYAFDATGRPAQPLWHAALADRAHGAAPVPARDLACPFIRPEVGITPTPAIDRAAGTIYVLARTKEGDGGSHYVQRLHALDVATGAERPESPVEIRAAVRGSGSGAAGGSVEFDPRRENPRSSLLLANGVLYLAWASSCDVGPYHGWIMAYDARTLRQRAVFNTSPDTGEAGIWQSDTGLAADDDGRVYAATGNGAFDAARGGRGFGNSVLKFAGDGNLTLLDYFTPFDEHVLNERDGDLGSGGPLVISGASGPHAHLLVIGGKGGTVYVIDRERMGKFHAGGNEHAVQTLEAGRGVFGAGAFWNGTLYYLWSNDTIKAFALRGGRFVPAAQGKTPFDDPGATVSVSADGTRNGIVWAIETRAFGAPDRPAVLHAYDAANVARELYTSAENSARDGAGTALRFTIPTVAGGRVYVGTKGRVDVYGLLVATPASERANESVPLEGNWSGTSLCAVKPSACSDENVVFRFSATGTEGRYLLQGDKIVDGRAVTMGRFVVDYDAAAKTVSWTGPGTAVWKFTVDGSRMNGTLTTAEHVVVRKVTLKKG